MAVGGVQVHGQASLLRPSVFGKNCSETCSVAVQIGVSNQVASEALLDGSVSTTKRRFPERPGLRPF